MNKYSTGFTLVELMITVSVAAILLYVSTSFIGMAKNNRISTTTQDIVATFNIARSEAATRETVVAVCKSDTSVDAPTCAAPGDPDGWDQGWIVFVDQNNNRQVDNNTELVRVYNSLSPTMTLDLAIVATSAEVNDVAYAANGLPVDTNGNILAESQFTLCDDRRTGIIARSITISRSGHIAVDKEDASSFCS